MAFCDDQPPKAWEAAIRRLLDLEPGSADALRALSVCLVQQQRFTEVREAESAARASIPSSAAVPLLAAHLSLGEGERDRACELLREAIRRAPDAGQGIL